MLSFVLFPILYLILLILAFSIYYIKFRRPLKWRVLLLYVSLVAMLGPIGEIIVGTFYQFLFGYPLLQYQVFPIHHAYTSLYAPVIWGLSGAFVYLTHELIKIGNARRPGLKASLYALETIVVEAVINLAFLALSGELIFRYTPGDLWHITSLQTLPFYFVFGLIMARWPVRFKKEPLFFTHIFIVITIVVVFLAS